MVRKQKKMDTMEVVNAKTGEIYEVARPVIPFRTILTANEYKDGEDYEEGTSCVDLTGFEPLASIVARCMRTMRSPSGATTQVLDVDALRAEANEPGIYEAKDAQTVDEAFDTLDPTDAPGFDLVDASQVMNAVNDNLARREELSTAVTEQAPSNSQAQEHAAVGNSEPTLELEEKETA